MVQCYYYCTYILIVDFTKHSEVIYILMAYKNSRQMERATHWVVWSKTATTVLLKFKKWMIYKTYSILISTKEMVPGCLFY